MICTILYLHTFKLQRISDFVVPSVHFGLLDSEFERISWSAWRDVEEMMIGRKRDSADILTRSP